MAVVILMFAFYSVFAVVINAQCMGSMTNVSKGCQLTLDSDYDNMEPEGDPLQLHVRFRILHLRDVPDSGGSFGVDIM